MKNTRLAQARLGACRRWPAATSAILSLVPVERRGLGTLAVDAHWRLYFDPDYLASVLSEEAEAIILHEVSHLLLRHHERAGNATEWKLWNYATDCSINERLQAEGHPLPPGCLLPETFQLPANKTAEWYYRELKERQETQQQTSSCDDAGDQQDQQVTPGTSGSCSDGRQRPWEDPVPTTDTPNEPLPPAMPKHEQEQVLREVAERIIKQAGQGAGNWSRWAQDIISPKVDPKTLLIAAIRQAVDQTSGGHDDQSYRRPSRRQSLGGTIRPGTVAIIPRILIIVDSSGSMNQQDLGLALGLIGKVLNGFRMRDGVRVLVGDTAVQSVEKIFDPKKLEIKGGGGTEIESLIVEATKISPRPQLIVVATDGYTNWPRESVGVPVVACLTREARHRDVPSWIKSIVIA